MTIPLLFATQQSPAQPSSASVTYGGTLPQTNATLTAIIGEGFSADGDLPAAPGVTKWSGASDAYVKERKITSTAAGRLDLFDQTQIILPAGLLPALGRGDTVTYVYAGSTRTRTIRAITAAILPGIDSTVRLDLTDT